VEVVSPQQQERDYRDKRLEYVQRQISEYWIIDPISAQVTVLQWTANGYQDQVYQGSKTIVSPRFPNLSLTVMQILSAGEEFV
jgi:Uma2 family endonuclease